MKYVLTLLVFSWGCLSFTHAQACKCKSLTPAQYIQNAEVIYLAKAHGPKVSNGKLKQVFSVLQTIKGERPYTNTWTLHREIERQSNCDQKYAEGDVSLLLISQGQLRLCRGNLSFAQQMRIGMAHHVRLAAHSEAMSRGQRPAESSKSLSRQGYQALFTEVIADYLNGRKVRTVEDKRHAGQTLTVGETEVRFTDEQQAEIKIEDVYSFPRGYCTLVYGSIPSEGVRFYAFLAETKSGKYKVVAQSLIKG